MALDNRRLGLALQLPPESIQSLHSRFKPRPQPEPEDPLDSDSDAEFSQPKLDAVSGEWDDTIAVPPQFLDELNTNDSHRDEDEKIVAVEEDESDENDSVSLGSPPSLPIAVVNLERLCGFAPSSIEEAEQIGTQVLSALSQDEDHVNEGELQEHDHLSQHFDSRVSELFENGIAFHGDTSSVTDWEQSPLLYSIVHYPEFLCRGDRAEVLTTSREWKRLLKSHSIPVIDRVLKHLAHCSRPLSWKVDMNAELRVIAKTEEQSRRQRLEEGDLMKWRAGRRKDQLDQLYQVRETFDLRLEAARSKLEQLEDERDEETLKELRRLRIKHGQQGGLEALDFETSIFSFGYHVDNIVSSSLARIHSDWNDEKENKQSSSDFSSGDSGYDQDENVSEASVSGEYAGDVGEQTESSPDIAGELPSVDREQRSRARRQESAMTRKSKLLSQEEAARQVMERQKVEEAHAEEERVRALCTTQALCMAQATVDSLQTRLQQVDDLLESLQEEEWVDEEDGIVQHVGESTTSASPSSQHDSSSGFSLLDSILAMILGTLPQNISSSDEDHFKFVMSEHKSIVKEWIQHFGRLPTLLNRSSRDDTSDSTETFDNPSVTIVKRELKVRSSYAHDSASSTKSPGGTGAELRKSLGIADNEDCDNWDDLDDWDPVLPVVSGGLNGKSTASIIGDDNLTSQVTKTAGKQAIGLRPGGKVSH